MVKCSHIATRIIQVNWTSKPVLQTTACHSAIVLRVLRGLLLRLKQPATWTVTLSRTNYSCKLSPLKGLIKDLDVMELFQESGNILLV